mmetsp:Transcript_28167/g.45252  ORF Transcript_28167/g.45252 Transcript_28167/m.45252 type:complete len:111 (+) Transcript_28167:802-1134(+)
MVNMHFTNIFNHLAWKNISLLGHGFQGVRGGWKPSTHLGQHSECCTPVPVPSHCLQPIFMKFRKFIQDFRLSSPSAIQPAAGKMAQVDASHNRRNRDMKKFPVSPIMSTK